MTNSSPTILRTNSLLTQNRIEVNKKNITPAEEQAIKWRILSSMKTEVLEIYSDGTEAKVSGSIEGIDAGASYKKIIARKFKFEGMLPSFHEAYKKRHDPLKTPSEEEVIAYRIVHSHSVEIEEFYSNGLLAKVGIVPTDMSIGGEYKKIKGRKFCCSGQIIIPEPLSLPNKKDSKNSISKPSSPPRNENKFLSDSLYGLGSLIVLALITTVLVWWN